MELCDLSWEGGSRKKPAHGFPQTHVSFSLGFGRVAFLHHCNHRHEYNYVLCLMSPSKSHNTGMVLGILAH